MRSREECEFTHQSQFSAFSVNLTLQVFSRAVAARERGSHEFRPVLIFFVDTISLSEFDRARLAARVSISHRVAAREDLLYRLRERSPMPPLLPRWMRRIVRRLSSAAQTLLSFAAQTLHDATDAFLRRLARLPRRWATWLTRWARQLMGLGHGQVAAEPPTPKGMETAARRSGSA